MVVEWAFGALLVAVDDDGLWHMEARAVDERH